MDGRDDDADTGLDDDIDDDDRDGDDAMEIIIIYTIDSQQRPAATNSGDGWMKQLNCVAAI